MNNTAVLCRLLLVGLPAMLLAGTGWTHHSFAMFDFHRDVVLDGTVKEFQWGNPHVFIDVLVRSDAGTKIWSVEMSSPSHLVRNGWKPTSLKAGDSMRIVIHPLRDGRTGGAYVSGTFADGRQVVSAQLVPDGAKP